MKIALVHDYLIQDGGAERVLQVFKDIWPDAPIFTLLYDRDRMGDRFHGCDVRTSFLQRMPFARTRYKWMMPLMPAATESYDLSGYDVVLSSTSAFAKGVITRPDTLHICYCHTPTRYLWSDTHAYIEDLGLAAPIRRVMPYVLSRIRVWDRMAADRVDRFIANSATVRDRIRKYYGLDSDVLHPPVDTHRFGVSAAVGAHFVAGGRLVAYKRFDLVVRAFTRLKLPLVIFGEGPEEDALRRMAGPNVRFVGRISELEKAKLYATAQAYVHPQEEDFGITAIEAMASGTPVIAYRKGGALETVVEGTTGVFFDTQTWEDLATAIIMFDRDAFDPAAIRAHAVRFDTARFKNAMRAYVERAWAQHRGLVPATASSERLHKEIARVFEAA